MFGGTRDCQGNTKAPVKEMIGAGKYDDLCTEAREKAYAVGAILIIIQGNKGWGFSVQAPLEEMVNLPECLRNIADTIEADLKKGKL